MKRKTWHLIHKWIAIVVGVFFLMWTVTGIVMMLPARWFAPSLLKASGPADYRAASLSPAEAIKALEASLGKPVSVTWTDLRQVRETVVYEIYLADQGVYLVDASSGEMVWITPELAEGIARDRISLTGEDGNQAELASVERLEAHDLLYPFGNLPVYRVRFEEDGSNIYYISALDGSLSQSNQLTRLSAAITSLHTFEPVRLVTDNNLVRKGLVVLFSSIGVCTALTGYLLALLPIFPRRTKSKNVSPGSTRLDEDTDE